LIRDGDIIRLDADANTIEVALSDAELGERKANWIMPPYKTTRGTLHKYIKNVKTASEGCVTDE
jgi:dihydroxy-acid dehydratase